MTVRLALTWRAPSEGFFIRVLAVSWRTVLLHFPLGAVVQLWVLTVLQVRVRQGVVGGWSAQHLLWTTAIQAILTAVRGSDALR